MVRSLISFLLLISIFSRLYKSSNFTLTDSSRFSSSLDSNSTLTFSSEDGLIINSYKVPILISKCFL